MESITKKLSEFIGRECENYAKWERRRMNIERNVPIINYHIKVSADDQISALDIDADGPSIVGGDATLTDVKEINTTQAIGGGGGAQIVCGYADNSELAAIKANMLKSVTIT